VEIKSKCHEINKSKLAGAKIYLCRTPYDTSGVWDDNNYGEYVDIRTIAVKSVGRETPKKITMTYGILGSACDVYVWDSAQKQNVKISAPTREWRYNSNGEVSDCLYRLDGDKHREWVPLDMDVQSSPMKTEDFDKNFERIQCLRDTGKKMKCTLQYLSKPDNNKWRSGNRPYKMTFESGKNYAYHLIDDHTADSGYRFTTMWS
jgi:hypothetical protein